MVTRSRHADDIDADDIVIDADEMTHLPGCSAIPADGAVEVRWADHDGWLHSCIEVGGRRPTPRAVVDSATPRSYGGGMTNTATATKPAELATPAQLGFLRALIAKNPILADVENYHLDTIETFTKSMASHAIETLKNATPTEAPTGYRWSKLDGEWVAQGPAAQVGDRITIRKANGDTAEAIITATTDEAGCYRVRKAAPAGRESIPTAEQVPEGHYALPSTGHNDLVFYRVDRPTDGQYAGRVFVKMIVGGKPEARVEWGKVPSILARIAEAGADESMALYGREIGRCGMCNRTLTDETSRQRGIGPDCYSRMS